MNAPNRFELYTLGEGEKLYVYIRVLCPLVNLVVMKYSCFLPLCVFEIHKTTNRKRLDVQEDTKIPNAATFKIMKQDHTMANMIRAYACFYSKICMAACLLTAFQYHARLAWHDTTVDFCSIDICYRRLPSFSQDTKSHILSTHTSSSKSKRTVPYPHKKRSSRHVKSSSPSSPNCNHGSKRSLR